MDNLDKCIHLIRKQRHDFMNDIQVLYGYLQMGRYDSAREYIENMSKENEVTSELYSLGDNYFAFCIEKNIKYLKEKGIKVELDIELDELYKKFFEEEYTKKNSLVNDVFTKFQSIKSQNVYIYLFEDILGQSLLVCNNESVIDELNWMESWKKIDCKIDNVSLYECSYGNNIGYRLTFN